MKRHHERWYEYATQTLRLPVQPEDIVFVRGSVKTDAWALAAYVEDGTTEHSVAFSAQLAEAASVGFKYLNGKDSTMIFEHRIGPNGLANPTEQSPSGPTTMPVPEVSQPPSGAPENAGQDIPTAPRTFVDLPEVAKERSLKLPMRATANQCVFLQCYKIKYRLFKLKRIAAAAEPEAQSRSGSSGSAPPGLGYSRGSRGSFEVVGDHEGVSDFGRSQCGN